LGGERAIGGLREKVGRGKISEIGVECAAPSAVYSP